MTSWMLLGIYALGIVAYFPLSHRTEYVSSHTALDAHIPLIPHFVIPYLFLPIFLIFSIVVLWHTPYRDAYLLAMVIALWTAIVFWFFIPTAVLRPDIPGNDVLSRLIRFVYTHDGAGNSFPSSHVFLVLVSGYFLALAFPPWVAAIALVVLSIVCSTVLIKQHYLLDIVGGGLWAAVAIFLTHFFFL